MNESKNELKRKPEDSLVEFNRKSLDQGRYNSQQSFEGQWRRGKEKGMPFHLSQHEGQQYNRQAGTWQRQSLRKRIKSKC